MDAGNSQEVRAMYRYSESMRMFERAALWTPGAAQTMSKQPEKFVLGAFPAFLVRGNGALVECADGHIYCDWICGLAAITLGYAYDEVDRAVVEQLHRGVSFSLPTPLEANTAEQICAAFPCGQDGAVRFVKTGSEADAGAVRIARRATGRDVIVACGYLGWHDWAIVRNPQHPDAALAKHTGTVAAVMMEPALLEAPKPGFLEAVKEKAHAAGALLIFDEVVCAGRWALGGGQEYYGVVPDLCTWGKGLSNGYALSGITGPRDLMKNAETVSGTFGGETVGLAACKATLRIYRERPVIEYLWRTGNELQYRLNAAFTGYGFGDGSAVRARCHGYGVHPKITWDGEQAELAAAVFWQECAANGVLFHPSGFNVSYSHGPAELDLTMQAVEAALKYMGGPLHDGDFAKVLKGKPPAKNPFRPA
jgi:glutamate-1-semialdehyde aminotransferase